MNWKRLKKKILQAAGFIFIPSEVVNRDEAILIHISDTPRAIFSNINRLVDKVKPEYIVHTGDMVDNLKLELYPYKEKQYLSEVEKMLKILEKARQQSYVVLGNHDLEEAMNQHPQINLLSDGHIIEIENVTFMIAHQYKDLSKVDSDFKMFGHQPEVNLNPWELNGISGIYVVFLKSKKIVRLDYPLGTDAIRTGTARIGI